MILFSTLFKLLLIVVLIGAIVSIFTFVYDVVKWHDKEEKVVIIPSAEEPEDITVKEVEEDAGNAGEHNTSTVSFAWSEP